MKLERQVGAWDHPWPRRVLRHMCVCAFVLGHAWEHLQHVGISVSCVYMCVCVCVHAMVFHEWDVFASCLWFVHTTVPLCVCRGWGEGVICVFVRAFELIFSNVAFCISVEVCIYVSHHGGIWVDESGYLWVCLWNSKDECVIVHESTSTMCVFVCESICLVLLYMWICSCLCVYVLWVFFLYRLYGCLPFCVELWK